MQGLPKFWTWLFKKLCNDSFYEELQGDLEERFYLNAESKGNHKAKAIYRKEVVKMMRPSVIKTPKMKNQFSLSIFRMHLLLAARNMQRNKVFSFVNVAGLAAAMTLCLFVVNMIYTGFSYDTQHKDVDKIYRVTTKVTSPENTSSFATSPHALTMHLKNLPQIQASTIFLANISASFDLGGETVWTHGYAADEAFFQIFNFKVIEGNPSDIFKDYGSIAITDKIAKRLYGEESAIGKTSDSGAIIRAVIESPEKISHLDFDFIHNIAFMGSQMTSEERQERLFNWRQYENDRYNYFKLAPKNSIDDVNSQLATLSEEMRTSIGGNNTYQLQTQRLGDIMFGKMLMIDMRYVHPKISLITLTITIIILISLAGFNYTNLSIARSLQRSKEIGIRKLNGSNKWQVISQFLTETCIFSVIALVLALFFYKLILPSFEIYMQEFSALFRPELNLEMIVWFFFFSLLVGITAGIFPALHFAKVSPLSAINSKLKKSRVSLPAMKKGLVGIQVCVSTFSIIFIALISHQKSQVLEADLGYETSGLLSIPLKSIDISRFTAALDKIPEIEAYSTSSMIPGAGNMTRRAMISEDLKDTFSTRYGIADAGFQEVYRPKIKLGKGFTKGAPNEIIVDESFLKAINQPLESAIGMTAQIMHYDIQEELTIVGIFDQVTYSGMGSNTFPTVIRNQVDTLQTQTLTVRLKSNNIPGTIKRIENGWTASATDQEFSPIFVDDEIAKNYASFFGMMNLLELVGIIIILIAVLGQFGIALFNAESRVKEIGIRKVLGANFTSLAKLFSRSTIVTLVASALIAVPAVIFFFNEAIIPEFSMKLSMPISVIITGIALLWTSILAIVLFQTWQTANLNPAKSLRND